jgi:hypothetical protein
LYPGAAVICPALDKTFNGFEASFFFPLPGPNMIAIALFV